MEPNGEDWEQVWDARLAALTQILGDPDESVLHAAIPFHLGGNADVLRFRNYVPGITYVTADLTGADVGQVRSTLGNYELIVCCRQGLARAAQLISGLSRYTCEAHLEPGETMDLDGYFGDSTIRALLFSQLDGPAGHFRMFGQTYGLLLCIGITSKELEYGHSFSTDRLLALLKDHGVFPYTVPDRKSVSLS